MKRISILGSTGSIGTQTLEVIRTHSEDFKVAALCCGHNTELFRRQLKEFEPAFAVCAEEKDCLDLAAEFKNISFDFGMRGLCAAAELPEADIVVNSLLGMMGLRPTLAALNAGKNIAFANKETLVAGGSLIINAAAENGVSLLPVDSEHSAIFQCLQGSCSKIKKLLLTASGGPFRGFSREQLASVTRQQALKHPNWSMGAKITVDSATMMNKGLEIIEASLLFGVKPDDIEVYVHPESIIHSAVEFCDGAVIAQLGLPDMKLPIAYALSYPKRMSEVSRSLDLFEIGALHFERPDTGVFRCLELALFAINSGQAWQIAMNAANEEAVAAFLKDRISFIQISEVIEDTLSSASWGKIRDIDSVFETERRSRAAALSLIAKISA